MDLSHSLGNVEINNQQSSWKATEYKQFEKLSYYQMLKRGGYGNGELKRLVIN